MSKELRHSVQYVGPILLITLADYINNTTGGEVARICREEIDKGCRKIVLDLSGTATVNSIGVSILIEIIERVIETEGQLAFCSATRDVEKLFHIMGLSQYAPILPSREEALTKYGSPTDVNVRDTKDDAERKVMLISATDQLVAALQRNLDLVYQIDAGQFELLVCDRLDAMGFEVKRVGHTFASDGGVDIVSWPKKSNFPYLFAVQVKHRRRPSSKVGPGPVKDLMAVLQTSPFDAGIIVTNTSFTPDAKWFARHGSRILRLRDLQDLQRWLAGNFLTGDLRDFPDEIELAPGVLVRIR